MRCTSFTCMRGLVFIVCTIVQTIVVLSKYCICTIVQTIVVCTNVSYESRNGLMRCTSFTCMRGLVFIVCTIV